ncbi:hypothetical protein B0J11DRAFT_618774, partial [Dendryphion nanum]
MAQFARHNFEVFESPLRASSHLCHNNYDFVALFATGTLLFPSLYGLFSIVSVSFILSTFSENSVVQAPPAFRRYVDRHGTPHLLLNTAANTLPAASSLYFG